MVNQHVNDIRGTLLKTLVWVSAACNGGWRAYSASSLFVCPDNECNGHSCKTPGLQPAPHQESSRNVVWLVGHISMKNQMLMLTSVLFCGAEQAVF